MATVTINNPELFEGLDSVDRAGGFDLFIVEVVAEVKGRMGEHIRRFGSLPYEAGRELLFDMTSDVLGNRMRDDFVREVAAAFERYHFQEGLSEAAAELKAWQEVGHRIQERVQVIVQAMSDYVMR